MIVSKPFEGVSLGVGLLMDTEGFCRIEACYISDMPRKSSTCTPLTGPNMTSVCFCCVKFSLSIIVWEMRLINKSEAPPFVLFCLIVQGVHSYSVL